MTYEEWAATVGRGVTINPQMAFLAQQKRIAQLERERDAFYMDYRMKCDEQTKSLCVERDALQADNERLREALEGAFKAGAENGGSK